MKIFLTILIFPAKIIFFIISYLIRILLYILSKILCVIAIPFQVLDAIFEIILPLGAILATITVISQIKSSQISIAFGISMIVAMWIAVVIFGLFADFIEVIAEKLNDLGYSLTEHAKDIFFS